MTAVNRGWFITNPDRKTFDYLSLCRICGAVVLDGSANSQSTWLKHYQWHTPEDRAATALQENP